MQPYREHQASSAPRHHVFDAVSEVEIDSAGRIAIVPALREFAGLKREVVVAGVADHVEIWDAAAWASYEEANTSTIEDAAEGLARSGIL